MGSSSSRCACIKYTLSCGQARFKIITLPLPFQLVNANLLKFQAKQQLYVKCVSTFFLHNTHYVVSIS
jgi:hypothetical protein